MELRLGDEKVPRRLEDGPDLGEERLLVRYLMGHPERQDEVQRFLQTQSAGTAGSELDPPVQTLAPGASTSPLPGGLQTYSFPRNWLW